MLSLKAALPSESSTVVSEGAMKLFRLFFFFLPPRRFFLGAAATIDDSTACVVAEAAWEVFCGRLPSPARAGPVA